MLIKPNKICLKKPNKMKTVVTPYSGQTLLINIWDVIWAVLAAVMELLILATPMMFGIFTVLLMKHKIMWQKMKHNVKKP